MWFHVDTAAAAARGNGSASLLYRFHARSRTTSNPRCDTAAVEARESTAPWLVVPRTQPVACGINRSKPWFVSRSQIAFVLRDVEKGGKVARFPGSVWRLVCLQVACPTGSVRDRSLRPLKRSFCKRPPFHDCIWPRPCYLNTHFVTRRGTAPSSHNQDERIVAVGP